MKSQVYFAFKDILRNIKMITLFILMMILSILMIFLCIHQLIDNMKFKMLTERIDKFKPTYFDTYSYINYSDYEFNLTNDMFELLEDLLNKNPRAYTRFTSGIEEYHNMRVIVVLGRFDEVFGIKRQNSDKNIQTEVLIGSNISDIKIGDTVTILLNNDKKEKAKVTGIIPKGTAYLSISSNMQILDNSIIVFTNKEINSLNYNYLNFEEIISNTCLLGNNKNDITKFIDEVAKTKGLYMIPQDFRQIIDKFYTARMENVFFFIFLYAFIFLFTIVGIIVNLLNLLNRNLREYAINLIFGAKMKQIYIRIVTYVSILILIPFAIAFVLLYLMRLTAYTNFIQILYIFFVALISIFIIALLPIHKLSRLDLTLSLRRDI